MIRDDDVCYYTPSQKLEQIYAKTWNLGFKVSVGVIPNVKSIDDFLVPPTNRGTSSHHRLNNNAELVEYLNGKLREEKVEIAQHGCTHESFGHLPEFCITDPQEIRARLDSGRRIIENCLQTRVSAFIPPWNKVSSQTRKILDEYGLILCSGKKKSGLGTGFNSGLARFHDSTLVELYSSFDGWSNKQGAFVFDKASVQKAKSEFQKSLEKETPFCLLNHYWGFYQDWQENVSQDKLDSFNSLLDFIDGYDVWKATISELGHWIKGLGKIRLDVEGKKVTLKTPTAINGIAVKAEGCALTPEQSTNTVVKQMGNDTLVIFEELGAGVHEFKLDS